MLLAGTGSKDITQMGEFGKKVQTIKKTDKHVEIAFKAEGTKANASVCKSVKCIHEEPCA